MIAELSANHLGSLDRARKIIAAAANAGADAVKLQTYSPDSMTLDLHGNGFSIESGPWAGQTLYELYAAAQTPWEWHAELFDCAAALGVQIFSSPFDATAVEKLDALGAPVFKIASFELVDHDLIQTAAATRKPLILSTGMASEAEIEEALGVAYAAGCRELALLHCVSGYPTPPGESNLLRIAELARTFGGVAGLSDHSLGPAVPVTAVALGARVIEKHLTLDRDDGGPDAAFSLEPDEFRALVRDTRCAFEALGSADPARAASEKPNARFRRSLYAVRDIGEGETLSRENVRAIRPGFGLAPRHLPELLGRRTVRSLRRGDPLSWTAVEAQIEK